jgi:CheY-like chemotaxis protein
MIISLHSFQPNMLISDLSMPIETGYGLIAKVREIEDLKFIPAIALSGLYLVKDGIEALNRGFSFVLKKPIDPDELIAAIHNLRSGFI